jgi:Zn-dependent alcohol dehydrogenase
VCPDCVAGHQNLCDRGGQLFSGGSIHDGTQRFHWGDKGVGQFCLLGTFAEYTVVHERACIKIDKSIPLDKAALVGCGVTTGFGTGAISAGTEIGDVCAVVGVGGIGMNAVQGFKAAGAQAIVAIDTVKWKAEAAVEKFGATHAATSIDEARELIRELTWGRMAQRVAYTVNEGDGNDIASVMSLLGKRGVMVYTAVTPEAARDAQVDAFTITHYEQQLRGALYGSSNPHNQVPALLKMYQAGTLKLDELITTTYTLDEINQGYADLLDGKNLRGVIYYDS